MDRRSSEIEEVIYGCNYLHNIRCGLKHGAFRVLLRRCYGSIAGIAAYRARSGGCRLTSVLVLVGEHAQPLPGQGRCDRSKVKIEVLSKIWWEDGCW
jgi:hypothetical protein